GRPRGGRLRLGRHPHPLARHRPAGDLAGVRAGPPPGPRKGPRGGAARGRGGRLVPWPRPPAGGDAGRGLPRGGRGAHRPAPPAGSRGVRAGLEPHTWTDPEAAPLLAALKDRGLRVGVLSNTLWTRRFHELVFARDGVLPYLDGAVY